MSNALTLKSQTPRRLRPAHVSIVPGKLGGHYGAIPPNWFAGNPFITANFNALMAQFPAGERFLMQSARLFRDQLTDPQLRKDVAGFIGQEAHHANEHELINQELAKIGVPTEVIERQVQWVLDSLCRILSDKDQMAVTAALEHFTSMLGNFVLSNPQVIADVDPSMRQLFIWHAIEESEHKAVAFDLYQAVDGSYPRLMFAYLWSTALLTSLTLYFQLQLMAKDRSLFKLGTTLKGLNWMFGFGKNTGYFRRMLPEYVDFFRRDFHPWEHDNSAQIVHWKKVLQASMQTSAS
ncbi:MAG: metal-dependent hydrolase [Pseudomonadota bacterium]